MIIGSTEREYQLGEKIVGCIKYERNGALADVSVRVMRPATREEFEAWWLAHYGYTPAPQENARYYEVTEEW